MKIYDLIELNSLEEKCRLLINHGNTDYNYYFNNDLKWLVDNKDKINQDFYILYYTKNIDFDILLNTNYNEDYYKISFEKLSGDFDLFCRCVNMYYTTDKLAREIITSINHVDYNKINQDLEEKYNKFLNIKNDYERQKYFDTIKRK